MAVMVVMTTALSLAACGSGAGANGAGNGTDVAFIDAMEPHHQSAIDMAEIAEKRGSSDFIRSLAKDIADAQRGEIHVMDAIMHDLRDVKSTGLGVSAKAMGMGMDTGMLKTAAPFDREFIDMMIPHHQGAIRMAQIEIAKGKSKALKNIAHDIISAQAAEIRAMNAYRRKVFGAPSPAGGAPREDDMAVEGHGHDSSAGG